MSQMWVAGALDREVTVVLPVDWDVTGHAGWRPRGRWRLFRVIWYPGDTDDNIAIFRLGAQNEETDTITLGRQAHMSQYADVDWLLPRRWDGVISWLPGGKLFNAETLQDFSWEANRNPEVALQFEWVPPARAGASSCRG